ncbi:malto-oligosyltrehalose synthase [Phyllobacterium sp. 0TCS1.6C]|uniref:malto-oligosyltrehalose synthase n=1 Tax=unclassified Phyllobacterium TaxID=2638441 RepID=UPI0022640A80|nr:MULTISPECIES: malto-oligosyltrehalose synthase [unclassified Phyllobacterium]MCX8279340.1 malto-oligosyltrehalose synthase [Phyllobacterium sp. 0TCS1.6C]MCX8292469.1 malto-oligosyltrehalose synthase [Phyllobacterium sp. 0TCS1.6A]
MAPTQHMPTSAYRLLLRNGITFRDVAKAVPYLTDLGIDSLSISSAFDTADAGSGRRSFDPTRLDEQAGGEPGFALLDNSLRAAGIPLIIDINPNQTPAKHSNKWWFSVLEWGPKSPFASYFDIDWRKTLAIPALERPLIEEIEAGNITIKFDSATNTIGLTYPEGFAPLAPGSYATALGDLSDALAGAFRDLAAAAKPEAAEDFRLGLGKAYHDAPIASRLRLAGHLNGMLQDRAARDDLLAQQHWKLIAESDIPAALNYRHSYDSAISVGIDMGEPAAFSDFHRVAIDLLENSAVSGFRVNQIDGLGNPDNYLEELRRLAGDSAYIVTDKILLAGEEHTPHWPVQGTAGYEFISAVANVLVDHAKLDEMDRLYGQSIGNVDDNHFHYRHAKSAILHKKFGAELRELGDLLLAAATKKGKGMAVRQAISAAIAEMPVFRTYSSPKHKPDYASIFQAGRVEWETASPELVQAFDRRFQQLSAAVMAQAVEESYRYDRGPLAVDDMTLRMATADDPVGAFHRQMANKAAAAPHGMVATSFSYATKFGEDARMRLLALSEAPSLWAENLSDWRSRHADSIIRMENKPAPGPETEWLIYQTLMAIWPATLHLDDQAGLDTLENTLSQFIIRAGREARKEAFWTEINKPYEQALTRYVQNLFHDRSFLADFAEKTRPFRVAGAINSFSQTVLKTTTPGIPLVHIGSESWDLALSNVVAPIDLEPSALRDRLRYVNDSPLSNLLSDWHSGAIKQRILSKHLELRRRERSLFLEGSYTPLEVSGPMADHVIAFARSKGKRHCIVAVPRLPFDAVSKYQDPFMPLPDWQNTALAIPDRLTGIEMRNVITDASITTRAKLKVANLMRDFSTVTLVSK